MNSKQLIKNQYRDQNQKASKHNILDKKSLIVITVHNTIKWFYIVFTTYLCRIQKIIKSSTRIFYAFVLRTRKRERERERERESTLQYDKCLNNRKHVHQFVTENERDNIKIESMGNQHPMMVNFGIRLNFYVIAKQPLM